MTKNPFKNLSQCLASFDPHLTPDEDLNAWAAAQFAPNPPPASHPHHVLRGMIGRSLFEQVLALLQCNIWIEKHFASVKGFNELSSIAQTALGLSIKTKDPGELSSLLLIFDSVMKAQKKFCHLANPSSPSFIPIHKDVFEANVPTFVASAVRHLSPKDPRRLSALAHAAQTDQDALVLLSIIEHIPKIDPKTQRDVIDVLIRKGEWSPTDAFLAKLVHARLTGPLVFYDNEICAIGCLGKINQYPLPEHVKDLLGILLFNASFIQKEGFKGWFENFFIPEKIARHTTIPKKHHPDLIDQIITAPEHFSAKHLLASMDQPECFEPSSKRKI